MSALQTKDGRGFDWFCEKHISVKGFAFTENRGFLKEAHLVRIIKDCTSAEELSKVLIGLSGSFCILIELEGRILLATDIIRSLPLFYRRTNDAWVVSDETEKLIEQGGSLVKNSLAYEEFLGTGYVTGNETLINAIFQVPPGNVVCLDNEVHALPYFSYRTNKVLNTGKAELASSLGQQIDSTFNRLVESLEGRTALVPLSGGFDSRLIAVKLKESGCKDIVCFTYGRKDNPDAVLSQKVAEILDLKWYFIEYSAELIGDFVSDPTFKNYARFASNHSSMFFLQEYFAVKYLKEKKLVPENAVFIPGHSGDFLGGSQFNKHGFGSTGEALESIVERIFRVKYHYKQYPEKLGRKLKERIRKNLELRNSGEKDYAYSIQEDWDMQEKLSRFNANSSLVYSFFGYEYRLPFWDRELVELCRDIPVEWKKGKVLYDQVLVENYFKANHVYFDAHELKVSLSDYKRAGIRQRVKKHLPQGIINIFAKKEDELCYFEITSSLKQDLIDNGRKPGNHGNRYNKMIIQWYFESLISEHITE